MTPGPQQPGLPAAVLAAAVLPTPGLLSRRSALAAGALGLALAACSGGLPAGMPNTPTGPLVSGSFRSSARRTTVGWSVCYPPGPDRAALPVLVFLHGRRADHSSAFDSLHLDRFQARAVQQGTRPFAIAAADGGDHEYWHPRRDSDPAAMVLGEFLPLLAARGLDVRRVGLMGYSMGGYGALYLASVLGRSRTAVAIAESPAIWHTAAQTAAGAFDDAADFAAHSIFGRLGLLRGIALRIDCGASDGFAQVTRDLRAALRPTPVGGIEPGAHDAPYWRSQAPAQLRFAGARLG